jgi:glutamyl/glutaminyl-tRNA synthetase
MIGPQVSLRKDTTDALVGAAPGDRVRPEPEVTPIASVTRFAPAPTGELHLGHLVNAVYVWGVARASGGRVILRIEDHDRQRSQPRFERAILDDLERMGFVADEPPTDAFRRGATAYRQSDADDRYREALIRLRAAGLIYACDCSRSTFAKWTSAQGRSWSGCGCPGDCRTRELADDGSIGLRVALDDRVEGWDDLLLGPSEGRVAETGDPLVRDRVGNWTYPFCVVVDDIRHGVDLIIRGRDLRDSTATQIRLATVLGRESPARFLHHPLIRRRSGQKLSKAAADTSIRSMLDAGWTPAELIGRAVQLARLRPDAGPVDVDELGSLFARSA